MWRLSTKILACSLCKPTTHIPRPYSASVFSLSYLEAIVGVDRARRGLASSPVAVATWSEGGTMVTLTMASSTMTAVHLWSSGRHAPLGSDRDLCAGVVFYFFFSFLLQSYFRKHLQKVLTWYFHKVLTRHLENNLLWFFMQKLHPNTFLFLMQRVLYYKLNIFFLTAGQVKKGKRQV